MVTIDGQKVAGRLELLDEEPVSKTNQTTYARSVRFWPTNPEAFSGKQWLTLTVAQQVTAYNNFAMEQALQQDFAIMRRARAIVVADTLQLVRGTAATVNVAVLPAEAAAGKTLRVLNCNSQVAAADADSYVLDAQGRATVTVTSLLSGSTNLVYVLDETPLEARTFVLVTKLTTDIQGVVDDADSHAGLAAGQWRIYTLSGQRLLSPRRGMNIVDGKKVVVK